MPEKNREAQKKAAKRAVQKHRQGITKGITGNNVTPNVIPGEDYPALVQAWDNKEDDIYDTPLVKKYHPLMYALVDKDKRAKLQSIVDCLDKKKLLSKVYYGIGQNSIDFTRVSQLLEATQ